MESHYKPCGLGAATLRRTVTLLPGDSACQGRERRGRGAIIEPPPDRNGALLGAQKRRVYLEVVDAGLVDLTLPQGDGSRDGLLC